MTDASFQFFGKVAQRAAMLASAIIIALAIIVPEFANAQNAKPLRIVRDSETESIIRTMASPLFSAAGLNPESVKIILVEDNTLNAFVSGGMNIFIHTGLITQSESPEALIGVIAHETGHIQGGHLVRSRDAIEQARTIGTITAILGTAAAIGSGRGDVAGAAIMGGQSVATRNFLQFSRTQESAADHAAFRLLDATNTTATGLEKFLGKLKDQDLVPARFQDPYMMTHPLNVERISAIREHIKNSPNSNAKVSDKIKDDFDLMVAKLYGFLNPFNQVLQRYPETDISIPARYARAIAHYRKANIDNTIVLMNGLIEEMPSNPYFYEMRGQALFENARALDALPDYKKAYELASHDALLALGLANVELELGDPALLEDAIKHFRASLMIEPGSAFAWRQLGIAYGRAGNMAMSSLALAEEALRKNNLVDAEHLATRAAEGLAKGSGDYIRALDVIEAIKTTKAQQKN
ncbi:MAG: M48 family metalloprotease [Rhodospirillaceae bacterium]|nr:M48 family metalloprotease [Rhodospirillaceae bacterium]